jgi:hypothetical protein
MFAGRCVTSRHAGPVGGLARAFGKDLIGWKHVGRRKDVVENGLIRTQGGSGVLYWAEGKFGSCVICVVYKMRRHNDNSGVFIRMPDVPADKRGEPVHGRYEVQIDNEPETSGQDQYHVTGTLYSFTKPLEKPGRPGRSGTRWKSRWMVHAPLSFSMA